ncbi:hypothetical protein LOZ80_14460 [Paenibacillus sp. HWE-109]|uniref:hypothetical protein n=1 Tax=Paenibacillus sp. HWE-109 TaxID=1306526 RepID=UPI001EE0084F|nr:hypothetical protein [Paenibacillus sp. HWE-109]UKS30066.1 hypothetical protein LOZ80_14460 [Paenibacillus sp. HWE-109]
MKEEQIRLLEFGAMGTKKKLIDHIRTLQQQNKRLEQEFADECASNNEHVKELLEAEQKIQQQAEKIFDLNTR